MKNIFDLGNQYVKESDWKDLALIKFCLCAMGVILGVNVAPKHKKTVTIFASLVFVATYIPLMGKLFRIMLRKDN